MKLRTFLPFALVFGIFAVLALASAPAAGSRSVRDHTARGYRAAWRYLGGAESPPDPWPLAADAGASVAEVDASGSEVEAAGTGEVEARDVALAARLADAATGTSTWEHPISRLGQLPRGATFVLAWPLERPLDGAADTAALLHHVTSGGRLVLLLDGASDAEPPADLVEDALDITLMRDAPEAPYAWSEWKPWAAARRAATGPAGTFHLGDRKWWLICPGDAEALATDADGHVRACRRPLGDGDVVVISDATVWQNDTLARGDNLALLDAVLGGRFVRFGEWHHGAAPLVRRVPGHVPLLLFAHLGALWLLAALTLARRFGDPLPPPALAPPSMARALHALATLHRGSGHAPAAAARLAALLRARAVRRGLDPATLPAPNVATDDALVAFADEVGGLQQEHRL